MSDIGTTLKDIVLEWASQKGEIDGLKEKITALKAQIGGLNAMIYKWQDARNKEEYEYAQFKDARNEYENLCAFRDRHFDVWLSDQEAQKPAATKNPLHRWPKV